MTALHPIRVVARRTGLKPNLIRAWERRYGVVAPERTAGGQRLYSEAQIERLLLLRRAVDAGHAISQVAALSDEDLLGLTLSPVALPGPVFEPVGEATGGERLQRCLDAIVALDNQELSYLLEDALVDLGPQRLLFDLMAPLLDRVGQLWSEHRLRPMHEHLATSAARTFIDHLIRRQQPSPGAPLLVTAAVRGQRHELGALLVAAAAAVADWRVLHLGPDLPTEDLVAAARETRAEAVAVSLVYPADDPQLGHELMQLRRQLGPAVPLLVGGRAAPAYAPFLEAIHAIQVHSLEALPALLAELRRRVAAPPLRRSPRPATGSRGPASTPAALAVTGAARPSLPARPWRSRRQLFVSLEARQRFRLEGQQLSEDGGLLLEDLGSVRLVAHRLRARDDDGGPGPSAGDLYALGLLHELYQELLGGYRARHNPAVLRRAVAWLQEGYGHGTVDRMLRHTATLFPTADGERLPDPEFLLHKALLLWLFNDNPAAAPARSLFDDHELEAATHYQRLIADLESFFAAEPGYGSGGDSLFRLLRAPVERAPGSLREQLELALSVEERVSRPLRDRLHRGLDVLREEHRPAFAPAPGPPPEPGTAYLELRGTPSRYPRQQPWMAELVLVAKHVDVWLHQLSRTHGRPVERLDQIPDEALEELGELGFNGLWLLGLWRRSTASERIKRAAGDPRAAASAYAIAEYRVAHHLGGDEALEELRRRANSHGLRLGSDFVPNHTALDSRWVLEHPERFLGLDHNPFPGYTFSGEDLSDDPRVGLYLEDHYRDRSDAAVVFQRIDRRTGDVRYVFHGNDGTGLPWNDTAQLDFLRQETRRAVIDELVAVARRFPIVRIDAAMALVRRHVLRLWYPAPGEGGAVPSRAGHGLSEEEVARRMPRELWHEALERLAKEAPETLLLAEGFWLMEAYLARNLGMHRVYHGAFMHRLRDEDNAGFRQSLAAALAFDRRLVGSFTNYLTNPDEEPAVVQLGKGNKYFALATLLATLPGLPLFGHGQAEGLVERYGMDYRHARFDEDPDPRFLDRHRREIAPLLRERRRFAGAKGFHLLDFELDAATSSGSADDVLAFVNRSEHGAALVAVHNRAGAVHGRLLSIGGAESDAPRDLVTALDLETGADIYYPWWDPRTGDGWLLSASDLAQHGLELELGPHGTRVLLAGAALRDRAEQPLARLAKTLAGLPAPNLRERLAKLGYKGASFATTSS